MSAENSNNTRFQWIFLSLVIGFISAVAGVTIWFVTQQAQRLPAANALLVLPEPRTITDFSLADHHGRAFSAKNLRGRWSLMFFGFTNCPDVCPNTLYNLKSVAERLDQPGDGEPPGFQVVFVSVDPERDSLESLLQYVEYFDPAFLGVTGAEEQLATLTLQLGIAFQIEEHDPGSARYDVFHSASILLVDPDGRLYGAFPAPHDAERMASDLADLIY